MTTKVDVAAVKLPDTKGDQKGLGFFERYLSF